MRCVKGAVLHSDGGRPVKSLDSTSEDSFKFYFILTIFFTPVGIENIKYMSEIYVNTQQRKMRY